jgi:hypothetical protein
MCCLVALRLWMLRRQNAAIAAGPVALGNAANCEIFGL